MNWPLPSTVRLFEVGPRDGLQNEKVPLSLESKLAYIEGLLASGLKDVEVGAFVREDKIPQMASSLQIFKELEKRGWSKKRGVTLWALCPNERGLDRALEADCRAIAVFTGATDTFTQKNIGMNVKESLQVFERVTERARKNKIRVRAYVSVCWGCPYEGKVKPASVVKLARKLLDMGVEQVSLGDTIGVANPREVVDLLLRVKPEITRDQIAGHFHDTRGTALPNCLAAVGFGVRTLDSASGGLGGCNYAPGASGNVATEDLVYMLEGMGIRTGVKLDKLCEASRIAIQSLGRIPASKYLQAWLAKNIPSVA
ncbi:MAG: hydroxymethylglutaryl-CoA lyase [Deltaproteobacteria bacterium]|nr:hydroxymethylglutaryl-CoA lyase [Deltaproteobacteria bacterium]